MKNNKKVLIQVLVGIICIGIAGCSNNDSNNKENTNISSSEYDNLNKEEGRNDEILSKIDDSMKAVLVNKYGSEWYLILQDEYGDNWDEELKNKYGQNWYEVLDVELAGCSSKYEEKT